jgi:FkbM family methyltransferase
MADEIDFKFLKKQIQNKKDLTKLEEIRNNEIDIFDKKKVFNNPKIFSIRLRDYIIFLRKESSSSSIMTYLEIFKDRIHMKNKLFLGKDDDIIVDIGANEGFYALAMKKNNPNVKIISIEPVKKTFELLNLNIKKNNLKNIISINKAITSKNGFINFESVPEVSAINSTNIFLQKRDWLNLKRIYKIKVSSIRLENLFNRLKLKRIDILKLDVEGSEYEILKSSKKVLLKTKKIVVEYHNKKIKRECIQLLNKIGFRLIREEKGECADIYFINKKLI